MLRKRFFDLLPTLCTPILLAQVIWSLAIEMMHFLKLSSVSFENRRYHNVTALRATISRAIVPTEFTRALSSELNR